MLIFGERRLGHVLTEYATSGAGGFAGATGRVDFKDIVADPTTYVYRGHISVS